MDTTEHVNGAEQQTEAPLGERLLASLETVSKGLSPIERLTQYQALRPELAELYESDPVAFDVVVKATNKKLQVKIQAMRQDIAGMIPPAEEPPVPLGGDAQPERGPSQATQLVSLAADAELFHTPDREPWATISVSGHREHWLLKTKSFRLWLGQRYYEEAKKTPSSQALQDALNVLGGKALFEGAEHPVFTRVADHDGGIYIDLCNDKWEAVKITPREWRVVTDPPVRFRRARGMAPLPYPVAGGKVKDLRQFVNVASDADWTLLVAWILATLRLAGPFPVLILHGEQGSAKSTLARLLRALIDPNEAPLRAEPREGRDLMIAATNSWYLSFDNISHLPPWLSDALCRLATGGGWATRELYTDAEEVLFNVQRPVMLNGIEELATRPDLLDRAILLYLPTIPEHKRRSEAVFWQEFERARPHLMGALLDVVTTALRNLPSVKLDRLPRMADFATWVVAGEPALGWETGTFMTAYTDNRKEANELALEASPVAAAVKTLIGQQGNGGWQGTASVLLTALSALMSEKDTKAQTWPKTPRALSNVLRRLASNLRAIDIDVNFPRASGKNSRIIRIELKSSDACDACDAPREIAEDSASQAIGFATQEDRGASHADSSSTREKSNENKACVASVASVAKKHLHSSSPDRRAMYEEI